LQPDYLILDARTLSTHVVHWPAVRAVLGAQAEEWRIREVGDGNLNLVFLIDGARGSLCIKQALPYVRVAGPSWPMTPERAFFEHAYYRAVAPHVGRLIPQIHHYEAPLYCTVMEQLSPHIILRHGLMAGRRYPRVAQDIGEYIARACFFTSDLAVPFEHKMDGVALFAANQPLIRITVDLVFTDPYRPSVRNRHTSPQLDALVGALRADGALKAAAARFGEQFLNHPQALLHGDLHSGSVMVTESDTRVIDPEFAFYGPIGFDLGAFFGNLLLAWYSQPGHASAQDDRRAYQEWILEQTQIFWDSFRSCFLGLWRTRAAGDAFAPSMFAESADGAALEAARERYVDGLFADMLGFGACKMIRRIVGFAHVADFERIAAPERRAECEASGLAMAMLLLRHPEQLGSMQAVLDAVPRQVQARR
jgi:5-methylthioribose kinase